MEAGSVIFEFLITKQVLLMKILILALLVFAMPIASSLAAAEGSGAVHTMECCNTTCPVCDMPVDKAVGSAAFKPSESVKTKHPGIENAKVGFCSEKCHMAYMKEPASYEAKVVPLWMKRQQSSSYKSSTQSPSNTQSSGASAGQEPGAGDGQSESTFQSATQAPSNTQSSGAAENQTAGAAGGKSDSMYESATESPSNTQSEGPTKVSP